MPCKLCQQQRKQQQKYTSVSDVFCCGLVSSLQRPEREVHIHVLKDSSHQVMQELPEVCARPPKKLAIPHCADVVITTHIARHKADILAWLVDVAAATGGQPNHE